MGADFLVAVLEIEKDRDPDWNAAKNHILAMSEHDLAVILNEDHCLSEDEADYDEGDSFIRSIKECFGFSENKSLHSYFLDAVDKCESMWNCDAHGTSFTLRDHSILICGGTSWGDEPEGMGELTRFERCGAAKAAGFFL